MKKKLSIGLTTVFILLAVFFYFRYFYVFASGTKAGVLNTIQKKGYIFKTWEGIIIQSGFKANVQSNEFIFSVTNEEIAKTLQQNSGKEINLHYKSYFGALPWRGMSKFIVDSIYEIRDNSEPSGVKPHY
jgi:hypothetical protein